MIVMKFGGTSLESASAIRRAAAIVRNHLDKYPVVVVSAMGETTDRLLDAVECAARGNSYSAGQHLEAVRRVHFQETRSLLDASAEPFLRDSIAPLFRELHSLLIELSEGQPFTPQTQDQALSYGERLSSLIVAEAFRQAAIHAAQVDARKLIITDDHFTHATPLYWETYARLRRSVALVARDRVVVIGGFIGSTDSGATTTLGRGGSDLTASLVAAGISADEIQIWTDVDGMLTCDPRLLAGGLCLREISYDEAQEMARLGAKVLCPESIAPALRQRIPIVIRNSQSPEKAGTRVVLEAAASGMVKSLASRTAMAVVHLRVRNQGILSSITDGLADLFAREQVPIDLIQAHAQGISFAVRNWPGLPSILRQVDASVQIEVEEERAGIWLIGEGIGQRGRTVARAAAALQVTDVRLISQGSSPLSLGFAVPEADLHAALAALHSEFFGTPDARQSSAGSGVKAPALNPVLGGAFQLANQ